MPNWTNFGSTWINLDMVVAWWTFMDADGSLAILVQFGVFPELVARMVTLTGLPPEQAMRGLAVRASTTRRFFGADARALLPELEIACAAARREGWPPGLTSTV